MTLTILKKYESNIKNIKAFKLGDVYCFKYWAKVLTQRARVLYYQLLQSNLSWKIAHLILNNLYRTENTLSGAWICELLSDWSKLLFGLKTLC